MSEGYLACRAVVKRFGSVAAVNGADLSVRRGAILALLGPSGCGKTTLLRLIGGLETPDGGEIELGGRLLDGPGTFVRPEQRRVAMVFQDFALFPHLTVAANIAFGLPKGADQRGRVEELLALVGLSGVERRLPHQLSGGQQQRVALARALAAEPALLLLDEPFSNLDPSIRARVRSEVKQLLQAIGVTAVFVTHDQQEALSTAELVAVMMEGRVLQTGTPADIYDRPVSRVVGEFIGDATFLPGEAANGVVVCELGRLPVADREHGRVDVMLRAEGLTLGEEGAPAEVVVIEYFGHDQIASVRLASGALLRVRVAATRSIAAGQRVGVLVNRPVTVFGAGG